MGKMYLQVSLDLFAEFDGLCFTRTVHHELLMILALIAYCFLREMNSQLHALTSRTGPIRPRINHVMD